MRSAPAGRSTIIGIRTVLAAVVFSAVVAAQSANAECSYDVKNNADLTTYELSLLQSNTANLANETFAPLESPRRRPCSGALCSGQPASSSSAQQIDVSRAGQWAIIAAPAQADVPEPVFCPTAERVPLTRYCDISVYHPPRAPRYLPTS